MDLCLIIDIDLNKRVCFHEIIMLRQVQAFYDVVSHKGTALQRCHRESDRDLIQDFL